MSLLLWIARRAAFIDSVWLIVGDWLLIRWNKRLTGCTLAESVAYVRPNTQGSFMKDFWDSEEGCSQMEIHLNRLWSE
jgi:hypothetical protein